MTIHRRRKLAVTLLSGVGALVWFNPATMQGESTPLFLGPGIHAAAAESGAYAAGTRAMNEKRWLDAVQAFDRVIDAKADRADAALYWKAYSLRRLGKPPLALATCYQLRSQYRASSWNNDCSVLSLTNGGDQRELAGHLSEPAQVAAPLAGPTAPIAPNALPFPPGGPAQDPNTELKILALNSMLNQDPAKATPVLRGILTGNQQESVKQHAIFVLAQSKNPEAQAILNDAVRGKMGADLQRQAIQMMAVFEGKRANDTLGEIYRGTTDAKVKQAVIQALFITQDAPRMVELARNEKDLELKRQIVSQLAIMQDKSAQDYMMKLLK